MGARGGRRWYATLARAVLLVALAASAGAQPDYDDPATDGWPDGVEAVEIARADGSHQPALLWRASRPGRPLVVSLHTWSGDWRQRSASLIGQAMERDWNWVHPDFQGPNTQPTACGSDAVVSDLDDAIAFARAETEASEVRVVGSSGGGYAALVHLMRGAEPVDSYDAWVPITDLEAWHRESAARASKYHRDVLDCTGSEGGALDVAEARRRSPLWQPAPLGKLTYENPTRVRLYAGVRDGTDGSVPITHSLFFYDHLARSLAEESGEAPDGEDFVGGDAAVLLASLGWPDPPARQIGGRDVLYERQSGPISLTVFQGRHEMLDDVALDLAADAPAPDRRRRVLFFGDSITEAGARPAGYVSLVRDSLRTVAPDVDVIGAGVSGNTVADLLQRFERDLAARRPDVAVVYIGINDVWRHFRWDPPGTPIDVYETRLRELAARVDASGADLVLCTPSVIGERTSGNEPDAMLDAFAAVVRRVAADHDAPVCDLRQSFVSFLADHNPDDAYQDVLTKDGVHLNDAGNRFVADRMLPVVVGALAEVPERE
ncbi:GDSL-type esterase/lipase family protein [Rubrivirga sp.]|uniref:SGNH/GDSL hydrolase family protein n=1 Tax=Rubrivirga sp. TaxID=1885344 RepID=UPI003B5285A3